MKFFIALILKILARFPKLKKILRSVYDFFQGLPPVSNSEIEITDTLIKECIAKPNPTILEIGCNDGGHTLWLNKMFDHATIYCFEPDPRAIKRFKSNVLNYSNINLFEMALSAITGEIIFHQSSGFMTDKDGESVSMPEGWDLSGSIKKPKLHLLMGPSITFNQSIKIKTTTLDDWCMRNSIEIIDFIWMDVQGAELDVFRGGRNALSRTRFIYTEYSNLEFYEGQPTLQQIIRELETFEILVRYKCDVLLKNKNFQ